MVENLVLLFDLDGTLVNTDFIYQIVWKNILDEYNIDCDLEFFNNFIKGKNDEKFLKYLIPEISNADIINISKKKDDLFEQYIKLNKPDILISGAYNLLKYYKNNKIAIVTSCNKKSAEVILNYTEIFEFVDILISANDCNNHKPHPEPYLKAIDFFSVQKKNCVIFEDSLSGFLSAYNSGVRNIFILKNKDTPKELLENEYDKIENFDNFNIDNLLIKDSYKISFDENLKDIFNYLPSIRIKDNSENIKSGYICDIFSKKIICNNCKYEIVIKISNLENELSKTALELDLYNNEKTFYSLFSNIININIPKFYGSFKINNNESLVLESLNKYQGCFNINLNNDIDNLLNVIKNIFNMHNLFYFDSEENLPQIFKTLKKSNNILYYKQLIDNRFDKFLNKNKLLLDNIDIKNLNYIFNNFENILNETSQFPLSLCHGDLKSPNIFYKNNKDPYFLDWQYIHLNKGVSDIAFLLAESINYDEKIFELVINYYYNLLHKNYKIDFETFMKDFKNSMCIFPFFVCVWFNSEDNDKLLDNVFPIRFMKNLLKYYKNLDICT